jgi:hypothetical protein
VSNSSPFIYAWVGTEPGDGILAALLPGIGAAPLVSLKEDAARGYGAEARHIAHHSKHGVRLVRWTAPETLEEINAR